MPATCSFKQCQNRSEQESLELDRGHKKYMICGERAVIRRSFTLTYELQGWSSLSPKEVASVLKPLASNFFSQLESKLSHNPLEHSSRQGALTKIRQRSHEESEWQTSLLQSRPTRLMLLICKECISRAEGLNDDFYTVMTAIHRKHSEGLSFS